MDLGEPDRVEPPPVGGLDLVERLGERRRLRLVGPTVEFVVDADFHRSFPLRSDLATTLKATAPSSKYRIPIMPMPNRHYHMN
jgi:hypothetical protein